MTLRAQVNSDVLGAHDLATSLHGSLNSPCAYCHVPHSGNGNMAPLWNQKLSDSAYETYTSTSEQNTGNAKPPIGSDSGLCLSCHDGTVAAGESVLFGRIQTGIQMQDTFGTKLQSSHPFSLVKPLKDSVDLVQTIATTGKTADPKVQLVMGNVECTSCHSPHVQTIDPVAMKFLVRESSSGTLCLACHDPMRTDTNQVNPLSGWKASIHATATLNKVSTAANVGPYGNVAANACSSCHSDHKASGPVRLLRGQNEQACLACHSGGNNVAPPAPDVFAEFRKKAHPFPLGTNLHDGAEKVLLDNNRHATCADCHNSHASQQVATFNPPPGLRGSQLLVAGIRTEDGTSVVNPALNQYENCLRCHGTSAGKQTNEPVFGYLPRRESVDPLNVLPQFNTTARSTHAVMRTFTPSKALYPSLLDTMLDVKGTTAHGRNMGSQLFCTDCHNSEDNREFGGDGASGPHGSTNWHILEHDYQSSQAPGGPGTLITINLNKTPNLTITGPYGMCAKCHDLNVVMQPVSWNKHQSHVFDDGVSCSVCHTAHGMQSTTANPMGERMVDFDTRVVGQNNGQTIFYNRGSNTCTLTCHMVAHNPDGTITHLSGLNSKSLQLPVRH